MANLQSKLTESSLGAKAFAQALRRLAEDKPVLRKHTFEAEVILKVLHTMARFSEGWYVGTNNLIHLYRILGMYTPGMDLESYSVNYKMSIEEQKTWHNLAENFYKQLVVEVYDISDSNFNLLSDLRAEIHGWSRERTSLDLDNEGIKTLIKRV